MKRTTLGRLLESLRLTGGAPYTTRSRGSRGRQATEESITLTRDGLAQLIQERLPDTSTRVTRETIRLAERGEVRPESMHWLDIVAEIYHLLPEERAFLLAQSPHFDTRQTYASCWSPNEAQRVLYTLLDEIVMPAWVHDAFGDVVLANEEAMSHLNLRRLIPDDVPFYANLWRVLCTTPTLPQRLRVNLARHLRVAVFPYRTAPYWSELMQYLFEDHRETIQAFWDACEHLNLADAFFEWGGRQWFLVVHPLLTQAGPLYLALWLPLGSLPPRRGPHPSVVRLTPWPGGNEKNPDIAL